MKNLLNLDHIFYSPVKLNLLKRKSEGEVILKDISFNLEKGKTLGIVGESGSGKTTLAKVIGGVLKPTNGRVVYNLEKNKGNEKSSIQILFQNSNELINPSRKVGSLLKETFKNIKELNEICSLLDIKEEQFDRFGYQLSGGERQRIGLARILSVKPELLILDEPFSAQDPESQNSFLDLFKKIKSDLDITIICISHDLYLLKQFADDVIVLFGGKIMEIGNADKILNNYRHPYTKLLIEAFNYKLNRTDFVKDLDELKESPKCSFYKRCEKRSDECFSTVKETNSNGLTTFCNHPIEY